MEKKKVVQIVFVVGLITIAYVAIRLLSKWFIPLLVIAGGAYVYFKYIKPRL